MAIYVPFHWCSLTPCQLCYYDLCPNLQNCVCVFVCVSSQPCPAWTMRASGRCTTRPRGTSRRTSFCPAPGPRAWRTCTNRPRSTWRPPSEVRSSPPTTGLSCVHWPSPLHSANTFIPSWIQYLYLNTVMHFFPVHWIHDLGVVSHRSIAEIQEHFKSVGWCHSHVWFMFQSMPRPLVSFCGELDHFQHSSVWAYSTDSL